MRDFVMPEHRRWANGPVIREVDHDRARWLWGAFAALILAAAPFAAYLLEQNECLKLSYEASALKQQREELMERERRLRMRQAALESLVEIETWAVERQGMVRPLAEQVVVVRGPSGDGARAAAALD